MDFNSKDAGELGDLKLGGWMVWWKIWGSRGSKGGGWSPGTGFYDYPRVILDCNATDDEDDHTYIHTCGICM